MSIRFACKSCDRVLSIASRKAGTEIECPECGARQTVPQETETAATGKDQPVAYDVVVEESSQLQAPDNGPLANDPAGQSSPKPTAPSLLSPPVPTHAATRLPPELPVPEDMILFKRHTLYVQAVLFVVVGCFGLAAGYLIGRGDASAQRQLSLEEAAREPVLIDGKLVYDPGTGNIVGDAGSVIIALPEGKFPQKKLSIRGIRPQDPRPPDENTSLRKIAEIGGVYARADASGAFSIVVPEAGDYWLLLVSANTLRPRGSDIDEVELDQMDKYFILARSMINRNKYRWTLEEVAVGISPVEHNFGLSEAE